jgi:hypothetical protein
MNKKKLSSLYLLATINAHNLVTELYESVHGVSGEPITNPEIISSLRQSYTAKIRQELDLLITAAQEYNDSSL